MYSDSFKRQVELLLKCMPAIREQAYFALKGGTALNLIHHDLPRLSVDIDLTYRHLEAREASITNIQQGLLDIAAAIKQTDSQYVIKEYRGKANKYLLKLMIYHNNTMVKIEPSFIARGTLYPIEYQKFSEKVNNTFGVFLDRIPVLNSAELYAGKLCAALNRQHPRDLFDVKILFEHGGISDEMRRAFVVYLACDSRPIHELLQPNHLDIKNVLEKEFSQMTDYTVTLDELLLAREQLIETVKNILTDNERQFLLSVKDGQPNYDLMPYDNLERLPALQWKLINVRKMDKAKREKMRKKLIDALQI